MYTNILIPTDGSELAGKAVQHGIALAKRIGAKVTVLTVLPPFHVLTTDTQMLEDTIRGLEDLFRATLEYVRPIGVTALCPGAVRTGIASSTRNPSSVTSS